MSSQSYFFNPQDDRMSCAGSGLQLPRLSSTQRLALTVGVNDAGLQVFDTTLQSTFVWTGTAWTQTGGSSGEVITVDNVAALKALPVTGLTDGQVIMTRGYYTENDGGQGTYVYDSGSVATDNGGTVIAPTAGVGRYLLFVSDSVTVIQFGARGNDVTDDSNAFNNAASYCRTSSKRLVIPIPSDPTKNYRVTSQIDFRDLSYVYQDFDAFQANQSIRSEFVGKSVLIGGNSAINSASFYRLKVVRYPNDWAAGSIGVSLSKAKSCDVEVSISGFEKNLDLSPDTGNYVVYCRIKCIEIGYGKWNIYIGPTGAGYVNANQFYGGSLTLFAVNAVIPEANIGIYTVSTSMAQDNVFREIDINGTTAAYATLAAAAAFKVSPDGNQYGTQGIKCVDCRIENGGAGVRVPLVIIISTTNKRVVDIDINVINNDFAEYFPIIPEGETHYVRFSVGTMSKWLNEGNAASTSNVSITQTGIEIPLYADGNSIYGNLRAPNRVIYNVSSNSSILTIGSQSIGGNIANTGFSSCGEQDSGITYDSAGTHYIVGQRYTKNIDKSCWIRVTDLLDLAVICFNSAGAILSGSSPYYAVGSRFRTQTNGGNGYYQFRGGWLWLHKDVASFVLGYQSWLTAGFNPYRDVIIQPTAGANTVLSNPFGLRSVGIVTSGVPKSFWEAGTVATDISGTARYQNSKNLQTTLAANTVFGASTITVADPTGIAIGDTIGWQNGYSAAGVSQWQTATVAGVAGAVINFAPTTIYSNAVIGQKVRVNRWTTF